MPPAFRRCGKLNLYNVAKVYSLFYHALVKKGVDMSLKIYNVMSRQKEEFVPLTPGKVKMYACGITVSGDAHVGHAYQSVVLDVITRYLA